MRNQDIVESWRFACGIAVSVILLLMSLLIFTLEPGPSRWTWLVAAAFTLAAATAFVVSARWPRRPMEITPDEEGQWAIRAPLILTMSLVMTWLAGMLWCLLMIVLSATGQLSVTAFALTLAVLGLAATAAMAGYVALLVLQKRLHYWRLSVSSTGVTWATLSGLEEIPWNRLNSATVQRDQQPVGVLLNVKGTKKDPVVPAALFFIPSEQICDVIEKYRKRYS